MAAPVTSCWPVTRRACIESIAVTTIDASQRLAHLLRAQVAAFRTAPRSQASAAGVAHAQGRVSDLASSVAARIQALAKDDPDRKRKALRIYLESLLMQHLGTDLLRDASFVAMVDAVQQQMEQDGEIAAAADRLAGILLAGGLPKG